MTIPNRISRCILGALFVLVIAVGGCGKNSKTDSKAADKNRTAVTALDRVTPGRAAISIAAQPGDRLRERLQTETSYAQAVIDQSKEAVRLLEISVEHERKELKRVQSLNTALAGRSLDDQQFALESREGELVKARAELRAAEASLARTRSTVAVDSAEAKLKTAEAQLGLTIIRAPIDGEILKVFTYPGERTGDNPILKMGDTSDMHVIAEVHETDVGVVRVGQPVTITSEALAEPVHGVVEEIGSLIYKNDVLDLDPRAPRDTRIVEVRVKLDKSEAISRLTHLEVSTRIDLTKPAVGPKSAAR